MTDAITVCAIVIPGDKGDLSTAAVASGHSRHGRTGQVFQWPGFVRHMPDMNSLQTVSEGWLYENDPVVVLEL